MTPIDKNRDPLDAVLRGAMRAEPGPATSECADAESLGAYSDRSLAAAQRERLEVHFADCMRCQMLLADIARADESARGEQAADAIPWYRRWRIAIPTLAAVAALVIFIAILRPANEEPRTDELVAMAQKREPSRIEVAAQAAAPVPPAAAPAPAWAVPAAPASSEIAMHHAKPEAAPRAEEIGGSASSERMAKSETAPEARAMVAQAAPAQATAPMNRSLGAAVAGNALGSTAGYSEQAGVLATVSPSDRSVTWIVGKNGTIRRVDANGAAQPQESGVSADLVAGSAPSSSVCWVVGRSGTILRTTDGEHWAPVASPTTENLVAVSSSGPSDARVTTSSSKNFATSDGGVSWHQQ